MAFLFVIIPCFFPSSVYKKSFWKIDKVIIFQEKAGFGEQPQKKEYPLKTLIKEYKRVSSLNP